MHYPQTRVTVKRIEKIPTQFYTHIPQTHIQAKKKTKVEISDQLIAEADLLSSALYAKENKKAALTDSVQTKVMDFLFRFKSLIPSVVHGLNYRLSAYAKRFVFSGALSIGVAACAVALFFVTCTTGLQVSVNGQAIGVVKDQAAYESLLNEISKEIAYVSPAGFSPDDEPDFSKRIVLRGQLTNPVLFKEQLKATKEDMLPAYGIYVNDEMIFSMVSEEAALQVLDGYKEQFIEGKKDATATFCDDVVVSRRYVPRSSLTTKEGAKEALECGRVITHKISEGESLSEVAEKYDISLETLLQTNYITDADADVNSLKIYTEQPLLFVQTVERKLFEEMIPFSTVERENPERYEGSVVVEKAGVDGVKKVDAYITSINDKEVSRQVVTEDLLQAPVTQVVEKGTKEAPSPIGTGNLAVPTHATLSSRFGSRWGRQHQGIDLCGSIGTEIYAADNGTVTYARYNNGGFGNLIQIDHGNGIVTYYAHCNKLFVSEGTVVAKGDLIATLGNTGRSTGPHLHFEVRVNGTPTDPLTYLDDIS